MVIAVFAGVVSCKNRNIYRRASSDSLTRLWIEPKRRVSEPNYSIRSRFVQLETTPESMFDYVRCLKLLNGKFYLLDRMGTKLLCFDRDGKFLKKFEARGTGPDEYFMLCFSRGRSGQ